MKAKSNEINMVILIYARLNSKRLPNKVLLKINSKPLIQIIIERIKNITKFNLPIIVVTSNQKSDDPLAKFCLNHNIEFFRGDLNNVFKRTIQAFNRYKFKSFIRVCADRPFFDTVLMDKMIQKFIKKKYQIVTNQFPRTYPHGLACEIADISIFKKLNLKYITASDKEHMFNFFYRNNKSYKIFNFLNKNDHSGINASLDDKKDLLKIRKIYKRYKKKQYIDFYKIKNNELTKYS
jgi:spore coat polysaccharide biosynthesis protein SpsF